MCPKDVRARPAAAFGGLVAVARELYECLRKRVCVPGWNEHTPCAVSEQCRDFAERRRDRAEAGSHVLDHLQRRKVEPVELEIGREADIPAAHQLDGPRVRGGAVQEYAVTRQALRSPEVVERSAADPLETDRGLFRLRSRAGLEHHLDPVPGLEAAAEADKEQTVARLEAWAEPLRCDPVRDDLDAARLDPLV